MINLDSLVYIERIVIKIECNISTKTCIIYKLDNCSLHPVVVEIHNSNDTNKLHIFCSLEARRLES